MKNFKPILVCILAFACAALLTICIPATVNGSDTQASFVKADVQPINAVHISTEQGRADVQADTASVEPSQSVKMTGERVSIAPKSKTARKHVSPKAGFRESITHPPVPGLLSFKRTNGFNRTDTVLLL